MTCKLTMNDIYFQVKRDNVWLEWTFDEYWEESKNAAKAFIKLGLERYHSVCILGFNAPEWLFAQLGAIMAGGIAAGIYTTNQADACKYIIDHSRAHILVAENAAQFDKFGTKIKQFLPGIKAAIQYTGISYAYMLMGGFQIKSRFGQGGHARQTVMIYPTICTIVLYLLPILPNILFYVLFIYGIFKERLGIFLPKDSLLFFDRSNLFG